MERGEGNIIQRAHLETKMPLGHAGFQFGLSKEWYISCSFLIPCHTVFLRHEWDALWLQVEGMDLFCAENSELAGVLVFGFASTLRDVTCGPQVLSQTRPGCVILKLDKGVLGNTFPLNANAASPESRSRPRQRHKKTPNHSNFK